jgi:hypothetical protein
MFKKIGLLIVLLLCANPALAAVTANSIVTCQTPKDGLVQFLQGTDVAGTYKTAYTAGTNGSKITALVTNNNDASATHLITCQIVNGGVKYGLVALTSVVNAGFANATPSQNLMSTGNVVGLPLDSDGNPYFTIASGDTLQCTYATALTSTDLINVYVNACDF